MISYPLKRQLPSGTDVQMEACVALPCFQTVSLCWLCRVIEKDAVGQHAELFDFSAHWDWGVETRCHFVSLILRDKAALFLNESFGLEVLMSERNISDHKPKIVMFLKGEIQRCGKPRGYGILILWRGLALGPASAFFLSLSSGGR